MSTSFTTEYPMLLGETFIWNPVAYVTLFVCVIGLLGNGRIIWLLIFQFSKKRATVSSLHLLIADALYLFGCFFFSIFCLHLLSTETTKVNRLNRINHMYTVLNNLGFNSTLFLLASLSIDQCASVCFPVWYRCKRPRNLSSAICAVMWSLSLLITCLEMFLLSKYYRLLYIGLSVLYLIISLLTILSCFVLLIEIRKKSETRRPKKLYIIIIAVVVFYFVSFAPVQVVKILQYFGFINFNVNLRTMFILSCLCTAFNACANPYIYIIVGRWGNKSSIKEALKRVFKEEIRNSCELESVSG